MNDKVLLVIFPLLPFLAIVVSLLGKHLFKIDCSKGAIVANALSQLIVGVLLIRGFGDYEGIFLTAVSEWKYSIQLSFDQYRVYFMAAYLVPTLFSLFHFKILTNLNIRLIFLFYLGGCSGLIVAGDIFNFYIFYEVMIMAAYILIAVNRNYYASIKYMMFGAISSAIFLAGIILLYASGSYFSYSFINNLGDYNPNNVQFIYLFFSIAFLVKGAFFPVSGWVATCHSATNRLISAYLSSFTIFSGVMGLFYFVVLPAVNTGHVSVVEFIGVISLLTMLIPSVILFLEPELKRCIAGSTVYTLGMIGLLISKGAYHLALSYLVIHSLYKSYMFLLYDSLKVDKDRVYGSLFTLLIYLTGILFTVGFFPSLTFFIKHNFLQNNGFYKVVSYVAMLLMLASFLKFRYVVEKGQPTKIFSFLFPVLISFAYLVYPFPFVTPGLSLFLDLTILVLVLITAKTIYAKLEFMTSLDTRFIYINMNYEILYIVILFVVHIMTMRIFG